MMMSGRRSYLIRLIGMPRMVLRAILVLLLRFLLRVEPAVVPPKRNQLLMRKTQEACYVLAVLFTGQSRLVRRRSACCVVRIRVVMAVMTRGVCRNTILGMVMAPDGRSIRILAVMVMSRRRLLGVGRLMVMVNVFCVGRAS